MRFPVNENSACFSCFRKAIFLRVKLCKNPFFSINSCGIRKDFRWRQCTFFQVRGVCICNVHFCGYRSEVYGAVRGTTSGARSEKTRLAEVSKQSLGKPQ